MSRLRKKAIRFRIAETATEKDRKLTRVPRQIWQAGLFQPLNLVMATEGKRLRAELIEFAYRLAGGKGEAPLTLIDFVELLHAGSLVIDDIQDGSSLRRGKPTLHEVVGTPLAINTGNWMYFLALEKLQVLPLSAEVLSSVYAETISTIRQGHEGQALDLSAKVVEMDREAIYPTVRTISRLKTGGLTALAAKLGAALAGADDSRQNAFYAFGLHLGIALQMQNDLVELRSATRYGGRKDDLRQARVTWPWAWFSRFRSPKSFLNLQCMLLESDDDDSRRVVANQLFDSVSSVCQTSISRKLKSASACLAGESSSQLSQLKQLMTRIEAYYV